jgi:hypothetical protein
MINFLDFSNFAANDRQLDAYETLLDPLCKYLLYGGAAGGGKSYFLRWAAVLLGFYYADKYGIKEVPIGLFSEDYPTLRDRQLIKIAREFPKELGEITNHKIYGYSFREKTGKWVLMLRNLDDPSKYSSVEFAAILVDELTKNKRTMFDDLRSRLRFPGIPDPKFVGATNPGEIGHGWVKSMWIKPDQRIPDPEAANFMFVPALYTDNHFIDASYQNQLLAISDPQKRRALMEGDWDIFEGQVFSEWRDASHITRQFSYPPDQCRRLMCFDWGYNAPGCCLWLAFTPENAKGVVRCYVYRELYQNQKTPEEWARDLKVYTDIDQVDYMVLPHDCFYKLGGRTSIAAVFQSVLGIPLLPGRTLQKEARKNRLAITHNYLAIAADGKPGLQVHPNCTNLIRTLPEQVYSKTIVEDVDTDGEDHAYDALSMGLMSAMQGALKSGAVRPPQPLGHVQKQWVQDQEGQIKSPDFWDKFKEEMKNKKPTSWEYR